MQMSAAHLSSLIDTTPKSFYQDREHLFVENKSWYTEKFQPEFVENKSWYTEKYQPEFVENKSWYTEKYQP